jgi:hypothetical protein
MLNDAFLLEMEKRATETVKRPEQPKKSLLNRAIDMAPAAGGLAGAVGGGLKGGAKGALMGAINVSGLGWLAPAARDAVKALRE